MHSNDGTPSASQPGTPVFSYSHHLAAAAGNHLQARLIRANSYGGGPIGLANGDFASAGGGSPRVAGSGAGTAVPVPSAVLLPAQSGLPANVSASSATGTPTHSHGLRKRSISAATQPESPLALASKGRSLSSSTPSGTQQHLLSQFYAQSSGNAAPLPGSIGAVNSNGSPQQTPRSSLRIQAQASAAKASLFAHQQFGSGEPMQQAQSEIFSHFGGHSSGNAPAPPSPLGMARQATRSTELSDAQKYAVSAMLSVGAASDNGQSASYALQGQSGPATNTDGFTSPQQMQQHLQHQHALLQRQQYLYQQARLTSHYGPSADGAGETAFAPLLSV
jgi:hypothetical protein